MTKSLAVFDFDRTIVNGDSDATIINSLKEKNPPPEWDSENYDWTPYMDNVFEHAYSAGMSQDHILDCIASMPPTPGVEELITTLDARGWDVLVITDANSVFVDHWFKTHGLKSCITSVITNPASWQRGRLYISPCARAAGCPRCPDNLCKAAELRRWRTGRSYDRLVYVGDGRNDYCPATTLSEDAIVFPRRGYPLHDLIKKTLASPSPQVVAKVVPWDTCHTITHELFPKDADSSESTVH
ncbi:pyridoxal phosphate phosphatase PHOSPHO2-like [Epargyreus clarus]|uniref:pyridoxal phosphate phosphatase PHOSPHO2-like n=1 Tax=Epargyreus clarus TaxID=520877 RepID=UPI003C304760